ncbi:protein-disulfide reductase DsbD family protein [Adhaeribacter pallidiroseus]|uniref:Protein-disulfide reductase n=1 Tax=Adhaeribacter pallidiroseus TaxID=2072847 RepID=A0A369QL86_9BACT|nr:cytochrome c biogenesis protein CcdA [Adhaeribacter pallidiroseus]RDC65110.1 Protein-disulfide reductase [Adhaeribacter pallidiroseus]
MLFLKRAIFLFFILILILPSAFGQVLKPATWAYSWSKKEAKTGDEMEVVINVKIDADWYLYSSDFDPNVGPTVTTFTFTPHSSYQLVGKIIPVNPKKKFDKIFGGDVTYFTKTAQFRQRIKVLQKDLRLSGSVEYQVCTEVDGKCIPFDESFTLEPIPVTGEPISLNNSTTSPVPKPETNPVSPTAVKTSKPTEKPETLLVDNPDFQNVITRVDSALADSARKNTQVAATPNNSIPVASITASSNALETSQTGSSLWKFVLLAFGSGLVALLTPCVFPMVPMTVTFFTGNSQGRSESILKALGYGVSIIVIYSLIGVVFSKLAGPDAANFISTHWLPNSIFFLIFLLFGLSFLGLFEITLPSSLVNKADSQSDKGGWYGIFFMAFTLVLVSFSCTGPIVGSILVASAGGETLKPIAGMFAYSLAFALPFTLFAAFPSWLRNLPKSGGWLNSVKVCLGFIELALALKFLSVADQAYHWGILDREIYLAIWIVLFALLGFYLLGKLKFAHDSDLPYLSVPRLSLAIITFSFVVYLIPGLLGAPLKALAGYLPPQSTHDFDLSRLLTSGGGSNPAISTLCEKPKYAEFLHLPHGIQGYFDLDQAKRCALEQNKPVFIDFTGHGCVNCREMEANVWSDPEVLRRLKNDFVVVALYVDDKTTLPKAEWYTSTYDQKQKTTIGKKYADFQITTFQNNAQPFYILMGSDGKPLVKPIAYDLDVTHFVNFLDAGLAAYKKTANIN